jgi:hypothetical protein
MAQLYGDATPFPYEGDFLDLVRSAVNCSVGILTAEATLSGVQARAQAAREAGDKDERVLQAIGAALQSAIQQFDSDGSERAQRFATRVSDLTQGVLKEEMVSLQSATTEATETRNAVEAFRQKVTKALEGLILRHDLPGSEVALALHARNDGYAAEATVTTSFNLKAIVALQVPDGHEWSKLLRVADLVDDVEVKMPREVGLFSKHLEMQPLKLDKLYITSFVTSAERTLITVGKEVHSGAGYELEISPASGAAKVFATPLGEDGVRAASPPLPVDGAERSGIIKLWKRALDGTKDLASRRKSLSAATFGETAVTALDDGRSLVAAMVAVLAPIVTEIARRSGAPGELVLRRDVAEGRREEFYVTKAELQERVETVPGGLRSVLDPLGLAEGPRSPRAPPPPPPGFDQPGNEGPTLVTSIISDRRLRGG